MAEAKKTVAKNEEEMVTIKLPRTSKNDPDEFVSINERTWLIKRGVAVEVPKCVAALIQCQEEMLEEIQEYQDSVSRD